MARVIQGSVAPSGNPAGILGFGASTEAIIWDGCSPAQVRWYLEERRGVSPSEALAYVDALRASEAGSLIAWDL